ncbi:hypothetical protein HZD82_24440, partial [Pantoea agglomerans]|nr:hypothetical protein [Pantoea agglomerans]
GYNTGKRKVDAVDAFASGPYELLGRQHELMVGVNYTRQDNALRMSLTPAKAGMLSR